MPLSGDWGRLGRALSRLQTLDQFIAALGVMEEQAARVAERAKEKLGTQQPGWPDLAQATQAERARAGYAPDAPLLRTGQMREDITATPDSTGLVYDVGIPDGAPSAAYAAVQELGSASGAIPPRPFLRPALEEQEPEILEALRAVVGEGVRVP